MGIKQLYNDNLRKLTNKYGDVSVMDFYSISNGSSFCFVSIGPVCLHPVDWCFIATLFSIQEVFCREG